MKHTLHTRVCDLLQIKVPIFSAPMGPNLASPALAAAVSNAGGLGMISFGANPPDRLRQIVRQLRTETDKPFAVNFILSFPVEELVQVCLEEQVPVLSFFWGDPTPYVEPAHAAGLKVVHQVGSVEDAVRAVEAGVDLVIAQGVEAGGHVAGQVSSLVLTPRIVDAVSPTPVAAAGGIADARGVVAALALGAAAVVVGTRFLATPEAAAHPIYKRQIVQATEQDTVHTTLFGGGWPHAPHRTLRTRFVDQWLSEEKRGSEQRPDEPVIGEGTFLGRRMPITRFMSFPPDEDTTGDIEAMSLLAGQSAGLVQATKPAAAIVRELVDEACRIIQEQLGSVSQERVGCSLATGSVQGD